IGANWPDVRSCHSRSHTFCGLPLRSGVAEPPSQGSLRNLCLSLRLCGYLSVQSYVQTTARAAQVAEARELHIRNCRAAREFLHKGIADVLQIFDSDFAGEIAVQGEIAEKSKEGDTGSETGILLGVCSIRDEIQDFFLLRG